MDQRKKSNGKSENVLKQIKRKTQHNKLMENSKSSIKREVDNNK